MIHKTRPSGTNKKSRLSFVTRGVKHGRARLLHSVDWRHGWRGVRLTVVLSLSLVALFVGLWVIPYPSVNAQDITWQGQFDAAIVRAGRLYFNQLLTTPEQPEEHESWDDFEVIAFEKPEGRESELPRFTTAKYYSNINRAEYALGNQLSYTAQLGPVPFTFQGGVVRMDESAVIRNPGDEETCSSVSNSIRAFTGWANQITRVPSIIPTGGPVKYHHAWIKGYLTRHVIEVDIGNQTSCNGLNSADYVYRYQYHSPSGAVITFYQRPSETAIRSFWTGPCPGSVEVRTPEPTSYWSSDGSSMLDTSNSCRPTIRWSVGSLEEFHAATTVENPPQSSPTTAHWYEPPASCDPLADLRVIDRNGNITRYTFTSTTESVIDVRGRVTKVTFDESPNTPGFLRLLRVEVPAPGGATPLAYNVIWRPTALNVNFAAIWPDVQCHGIDGSIVACLSSSVDVVDSITIPDGRSTNFTYSPWGSLNTVTEPNGAIREYRYGDATNTTYAQNVLPLVNRLEHGRSPCGALWTGEMVRVQARGVTSQIVYPQGLSGIAETTSISYEKLSLGDGICQPNLLGAATAGPDGCVQVWKVTTLPDNSRKKMGIVVRSLPNYADRPPLNSGPPNPHGWEIGQETWAPNVLSPMSASYNGDKSTGELFYQFETASTLRMPVAAVVDLRTTRTKNIKDGIIFTSTFTYADIVDIDPGSGQRFRNTKNVTEQCVWSGDANDCLNGSGTKLAQTDTNYFHQDHPAYVSRNILHLPATQTLRDPLRGLLTRTDYNYDQFSLFASGAPNLDTTIGSIRGNVTTATSYVNAANQTGAVSSETHYFDTGDVQQTLDPLRRNPITSSYTFGLCSNNPVLTSTVENVLGHQTQTVSDCFSGLTLRVTDPNGQSVYSQYDALGRLVETAGPADTLTPLAGLTRDPNAPLNGGAVVGASGQGPTSWIEYFRFGLEVTGINQQRTVTHAKDGTANGRYVKTFVDGLGRTVQTRAEVDPNFSSGNPESVATTEYDNMGRVSKSYVSCFSSASDAVTAHCTSLSTTSQYDGLGRVISITPPGVPATTTSYDGFGTQWLTTVTDAKGNLSTVFTDVLGRAVKTSRKWTEGVAACSDPDPLLGDNWCTTTMDYDAAGRLLSTTDPGGNVMSFIYDGLGRKKDMTDPDMGHWHYEYDDNGNLISQTDAKGEVITMQYDALNRILLKDLLPAGLGEEDVTYFYDGDKPLTCYSCDDHCAGTDDTCDPATLTCTHTLRAGATPCDGGPTNQLPTVSITQPSDGQAFTAPANITITALATDNDGTISKVEFFVDGSLTPIATDMSAPYTTTWTGVGAGGHTITAKATDNLQATASAQVSVTVNNGAAAQTPFNGPHNVPGITQAEDFDDGSEGVAYHDNVAGNEFGLFYRTNVDVDIYSDSFAQGGAGVGNARQGEWLEYTVNVTAAATASYDLVARVASDGAGGAFHYVIDPDSAGQIITAQLTAPNTFGWNNYQNAPAATVSLTPGTHIIRLALDLNGTQAFPAVANFDCLNITAVVSGDNAAFESQIVPTSLTTGQTATVQVRMRNTGTTTWTTANYTLGTQNPANNTIFGGVIPVPAPVAPGGIGDFTFNIIAPATPGTYHFQRQMKNNASFFGATTLDVPVTVTAPANNPPRAVPGGFYSGIVGTAVQFNGGDSFDPDGQIVSYQWNFGDGSSLGAGVAPTHTYAAVGTYLVTLTVTDNGGATDSRTTQATISTTPPYFSLAVNGSGQWFQANSSPTIDIDGTATSLTVEAWIKTDIDYGTCSVCPAQDIVSRFNPTATKVDGGYELWIAPTGKVKFAVYKNGANFGVLTSAQVVGVGGWHHVAGVYKRGSATPLSVYVDGVRTGPAASANAPRPGNSPLTIGKSSDPNNPAWFRGKIDEVRISAEEVYTGATIADYLSLAHLFPRPGGTTRALWKFDSQSSGDSSGNGNGGTLLGGAGFSPDVPDFTVGMNIWRREAFADLVVPWVMNSEHYGSASNGGPQPFEWRRFASPQSERSFNNFVEWLFRL